MPRAVGLEITDSVVRAADLEGSAKKLRLLQFAEREISADAGRPWPERAAAAVSALFTDLKLPRDRVVAALDAGDVFFRFLALPFKHDDQIRKVVKFELESQIQNYAADDLIVDYIPAEQNEKGTLLLTVAAPKTVVRNRLALLEKAGVDPVAIDLDVNALFNAYARGVDLRSDEPFVLAHGGSRFTKLLFIQRKIPRFVRTLRFAPAAPGAGRLAEPSADAPVGAGVAPSADAVPGSPAPSAAGDRIAILGREIRRFLLSSLSPSAPTCLLLTGEFDRHPEIAPRLAEETQLVTDTVDFLAGMEHPYGEGAAPPGIAVALGLALKGLDIDRTRFDFRKEEFVCQRRFALVKKTLAASVFLTLLLLLFPAVDYQLLRADYRGQLDRVLDRQEEVLKDVVAKAAPGRKVAVADREKILEELRKMRRELEEKLGRGTPLPTTAVDYMRAIFESSRAHLAQQAGPGRNPDFFISMERFSCNLSPQVLQIEFGGQVNSPPVAEGLQNQLKSVKGFETVSLEGVTHRPQEDKYGYTLRIKIRKPE